MEFLSVLGVEMSHKDFKSFVLQTGRIKKTWRRHRRRWPGDRTGDVEIPVISNQAANNICVAIVYRQSKISRAKTEKGIEAMNFLSPTSVWGTLSFRKHERFPRIKHTIHISIRKPRFMRQFQNRWDASKQSGRPTCFQNQFVRKHK